MKLLILTQVVDINDKGGLGFFHKWLEVFAGYFEHITVICLYEGEHHLPSNVEVHSLGKENGVSRIKYVSRFYYYIWKYRKNYDSVYVHMNQEYMLLGGLVWHFLGKRIAMWYNHGDGSWKTRLAGFLAYRVLHTSPQAYTAKFSNASQMPVGIDTDMFRAEVLSERKEKTVLSLGRISPVKNIEFLIKSAKILLKENSRIKINIYTSDPDIHPEYYKHIRDLSKSLEKNGRVSFYLEPTFKDLPPIFSSHSLFVNMTQSGSFDKTIPTAMASETPILVSNKSLKGVIPEQCLFEENDLEDFIKKMKVLLDLSPEERQKLGKELRTYVVKHHSLVGLAHKLVEVFSTSTSVAESNK